MELASDIGAATLQAYVETDYRVGGEAPFALNVGVASSALQALHRAHRTDSSAFVTACNPLGQALDVETNTGLQLALEQELKRRSLVFIEGVGQHPSDPWPGEASFLVLGLTLEAAKTLGAHHRQNAILWSGKDAVPQLILLR